MYINLAINVYKSHYSCSVLKAAVKLGQNYGSGFEATVKKKIMVPRLLYQMRSLINNVSLVVLETKNTKPNINVAELIVKP